MKALFNLFVFLTVLAPGLAEAALPPAYLRLGYGAQVLTDRSWDLVDRDDHLPMFRLTAGYSLELAPGALDLDLTYSTGSSAEVAHAQHAAGLWLRGVEVGGTFRLPLWSKVHPYGRLAGSWDWATLSVNGASLEQTVSTVGGTLQAGVQGRFPLGPNAPRARLVVDLGVGYTLRPAYGFHALRPRAPADPGPDEVPTGGVNLGAMPMSGICFALTVGVSL